ncbi:serine/threonine-protein kinase [Actinomadura rubteroloni]|uniref:serine/threonine-protein kinase n=1 Tax=Actinomadura rubteroloni TaxID=1926885 RepID=UPI00196A81A5|nr:serine/threonine-protein kinase [Actinomadura rubteroloni]
MSIPPAVGRYRIERVLGSGAFASVWLGHDDALDSQVAIKVLSGSLVDDLDVRSRFLEEARILRRADSDRLVRVHDIGELPDRRPYFVMPYADRGTLADRMRDRPLPVAEALALAEEIAYGVEVINALGVIHRDLKPSNVLFQTARGGGEKLLIADLGLAKALAHASGAFTLPVGTPGYMSPEQARFGGGLDVRADVYGLGALTYHMLAGRPPGPAPVRRRPGELREGVPAEVDEVIVRALDAERDRRHPTAQAFAEAVAALRATLPAPHDPPTGPPSGPPAGPPVGPPPGTPANAPAGSPGGPSASTMPGTPAHTSADPAPGAPGGPPAGATPGPPVGPTPGVPPGPPVGAPSGTPAGPPGGPSGGPPSGAPSGAPSGRGASAPGGPSGMPAGPGAGAAPGTPSGASAGPPGGAPTGRSGGESGRGVDPDVTVRDHPRSSGPRPVPAGRHEPFESLAPDESEPTVVDRPSRAPGGEDRTLALPAMPPHPMPPPPRPQPGPPHGADGRGGPPPYRPGEPQVGAPQGAAPRGSSRKNVTMVAVGAVVLVVALAGGLLLGKLFSGGKEKPKRAALPADFVQLGDASGHIRFAAPKAWPKAAEPTWTPSSVGLDDATPRPVLRATPSLAAFLGDGRGPGVFVGLTKDVANGKLPPSGAARHPQCTQGAPESYTSPDKALTGTITRFTACRAGTPTVTEVGLRDRGGRFGAWVRVKETDARKLTTTILDSLRLTAP